jgi:hypothetical protein
MRFETFESFLRSFQCRIVAAAAACALVATPALGAPRVVLISLDGGTPRLVQEFMRDGTIPRDRGLGALAHRGLVAERDDD